MCDADRAIQATDDQITADSRVVISTVAAFLVYFSSIYSAKVKPVVDKAFCLGPTEPVKSLKYCFSAKILFG